MANVFEPDFNPPDDEDRPRVRTPEGWRQLVPGELVAFPRGRERAHHLAARFRLGDAVDYWLGERPPDSD
jgi:hypothetical protein